MVIEFSLHICNPMKSSVLLSWKFHGIDATIIEGD